MDTAHVKLQPFDTTVANSVRHLAKSVNAVASQLVGDLYGGSDLAATLLWAHGELDRLSTEAESISGDVLQIESGKVGAG